MSTTDLNDRFFQEVNKNRIEKVDEILTSGVINVNLRNTNDKNKTALHIAAQKGRFDLICLLVDKHHASVNIADSDGQIPLQLATDRYHMDIVKFLLKRNSELREYAARHLNTDQVEELFEAAEENNIDKVLKLVNGGVDINSEDRSHHNRTILELAASLGHHYLVRVLVDHGADMQHDDDIGECAYHKAVNNKHENIAIFLVERINNSYKMGAFLSSDDSSYDIIDIETLKCIYEPLYNSAADFDNDILLNSLKHTALQCYDFKDSTDLYELMGKKILALRCLLILQKSLNEEFCSLLYCSVNEILQTKDEELPNRNGFKYLDDFVTNNDNLYETLRVLQSLMVCLVNGRVNFSIFEEFPSQEWRRELLMFALFSESNDINAVQPIVSKVNEINCHQKSGDQDFVENVLECLLESQNEHEFDINFVNDLFSVIPQHPEILLLLFQNFSAVQNEINFIKTHMIEMFFSQFDDFQKYATELKYFLKYPIEVIQVLTTERKMASLIAIIDLKEILEICDMDLSRQIKIMMRLDPVEPLTRIKEDIAVEIVKDIISDVFAPYDNYCAREIYATCGMLNRIHLVTSTKIKCMCFDGNIKCPLHHKNLCCDLLYVLNVTIARVIFNCCNVSEQVIDSVGILISGINHTDRIIQLINALETIEDYDIQFTGQELYKFFTELTAEDYEHAVHKFVIEHSFPGTYEKSVDQLLNEMEHLNPGITNSIVELFANIKNSNKRKSVLFPDGASIGSWSKSEIEKWSKTVRQYKMNGGVSDEEILIVIKQTAKVTLKLKLRDVQLLAVLVMIKSDQLKGRLGQVNTGEGKTLIIAVLAAYCVFKDHEVDVYTSSPLLAIPQSNQFKDFFNTLAISVANNIHGGCCYKYDVIYGTNISFQRDVLMDEFRKSGVRQDRKYDVAIVDEVDNMLIDGNNWILKISCDMPAMDYLEVLLAAIYIQVNEAASVLIERDGRNYYLLQENAIDDQGNVKPEIQVREVPIEGTNRDFIMHCTENHIRMLIRDTNSCENIDENYPEIKIPNHLRDIICKVHLSKWIGSAINAIFSYVKDEDYIINNGKITIVDADNTGVLKKNSHWCAGLHQFLEIKHGAKVSQESFTTNFISNVGLFTRYTSKLYGFTGTLGSNDTKTFLQNTYDVDSVIIPPFKLKQHVHLKPIIINNEDVKYIEIAKSCIRKLRNGRAALIILKYIKETEELAKVFTEQCFYDNTKIKLFKTDDDSDVIEKPLRPGDVIITTNIAGRGTDIKLDKKVELNGGLHVCLTFLPLNCRVEHQNIGRTSRKGNRGTSQLVLYDPSESNIHILRMFRSIKETKVMEDASNTVKRIKSKDLIFHKFCNLLGEIKGRNLAVRKIEQKAVEERFAHWLLMNEEQMDNNCDEILKIFEEFRAEILKDDSSNALIKNPYMFVELGNKYLKSNNFQRAIDEYTSAIILDHNFAEHAYYNRAWALIGKYGGDVDKYDHFINEAIRDLRKARSLIDNREYSLHLLQTASKGDVFSEQVTHRLNLYAIQKNTIDLAIGPDVDAIEEQLKRQKQDLNNTSMPSDQKSKISETIKSLEERKQDVGVIGRAKRNKRNIKIESVGDEFIPKVDQESHKAEIEEFERNGFMGGFKITEIKPIDWTTVISLLAIGLGQLIIGVALTVFTLGAGASIGMGLISEGVSDIITAVKDGIINRDFDWAGWTLMKVISLTVSIVCAGFNAIKDLARAACSSVKNVVTQGAKAFTQTTKQGWKIVAKKIGIDLAKGVAKEIVTDLVAYGIDKTILPMIEELIAEKVRTPIQEALVNNPKVSQMLKLDEKNQNHNYQNQIRTAAQTILSPKTNSTLKTIATQIATRVADNKGLALGRQACIGIIGIYELSTFTSNFISEMNSKICQIKVNIETSTESDENSSNQRTTESENEYSQETGLRTQNEDIDLRKVGQAEEQVKLQKNIQTADGLSDELASMVSTNMLHVLKGKIIAPITQLGVSYTIDSISSKVNKSLNNEIENYRSLKNIIHCQNKPSTKLKKTSEKINTQDEVSKVDEIIGGVKNGGPAGLLHLGAVSDATDRPIEVYDEKGRLKFVIGSSKKSTPIEVQYHQNSKNETDIGHFTLKGCREPHKKGVANNMCLFNVVAEQTGHNPNDLKKLTVNIMENNKSAMIKQVKHIRRLEMYDKSTLIEGGAQYNGKNPDHARDFLRNANGVKGFYNKKRGHADTHIPFKGKTIDKLNCIADETGRHIEVYDKEGNLSDIIGKKGDNPIKLQYTPKGDTSPECFSSLGSNEKYYFHDPNDMSFYNFVSEQTGIELTELKIGTERKIDQKKVYKATPCLENESKKFGRKTGFISEDEQAFVLHHAMQTDAVKDAMNELNEYKVGVNDSEQYKKKAVYISAKELNLPRQAYGGQWIKGNLKESWPVNDVMVVLQHYKKHESNPNARVHVQTFYPKPPHSPGSKGEQIGAPASGSPGSKGEQTGAPAPGGSFMGSPNP